MRSLVILSAFAFVVLACQIGSITISYGQPTATSTFTPTPTVDVPATTAVQAQLTATAQAQATATAQVIATATAQAKGTATAQALATATAQAQATGNAVATLAAQTTATARAQATATGYAQATSAAQAAAIATNQALVAAINAMVNAQTAAPYVVKEETISGQPSPWVTVYNPELNMLNFAAEVEFFNPADSKIHPWDFGFFFRASRQDQYRLVIYSEGAWTLWLIDRNLADSVDGKIIAQGAISNLNVSQNGSNVLRLVVKDKNGFLFVNNQYIGAMDVSARQSSGNFQIGTGMEAKRNFPDLKLHFKNLNVKWLP